MITQTLVYRWDAVSEDITSNGVTMETVSGISSSKNTLMNRAAVNDGVNIS